MFSIQWMFFGNYSGVFGSDLRRELRRAANVRFSLCGVSDVFVDVNSSFGVSCSWIGALIPRVGFLCLSLGFSVPYLNGEGQLPLNPPTHQIHSEDFEE